MAFFGIHVRFLGCNIPCVRQKFSRSARYDLAFLVLRISVAVAVAVAWSEWGFLGKEFVHFRGVVNIGLHP